MYWNAFDLAVQRQSGVGGFNPEVVAARGHPPPPLFKPRPSGEVTRLPSAQTELRMPLSDVLDRRRSARSYGERALTVAELSTLLYHSARVIAERHVEGLGDHALRPFPGGGARSELEIYVIANDVDGLRAGAHYFDARRHDLIFVRERDAHQDRLNRQLHMATGNLLTRDPPVVLLITAVFARMMWKYTGIGLGVIYKNTGALYQTLYLVATALNLAPCGIGGGEEAANSRWLGLDPLVESQVGCMLIGPPDAHQRAPARTIP